MDNQTRMTVRLPDDVHARLKRAADRNRRSLHAQILRYVELGLSLDEGSPEALASIEATNEIYRRAVEGIPRRSWGHDQEEDHDG
jgi:hypothetical protein